MNIDQLQLNLAPQFLRVLVVYTKVNCNLSARLEGKSKVF
jgi:hypothetical protein